MCIFRIYSRCITVSMVTAGLTSDWTLLVVLKPRRMTSCSPAAAISCSACTLSTRQ